MTKLRIGAMLLLALLAGALAAGSGTAQAAGTMPSRYVLPGEQVFPEGIAYEASSNAFYVGSTTDGTIFRGNVSSGVVTVFSAGGLDGRAGVTGMKADGRGHLFVAGAASGMIFVYNTRDSSLVGKFDTGSAPKTFLNDITLTPDGSAYVTDSISPYLYKLTPNGAGGFRYERWLDFTGTAFAYVQGFNANGIVASADGAYLLIVQSATGRLYRVATSDKTVSDVDLGGGTLANGDGMWLTGHTLYVMRNTFALVVLTLTSDYSAATVNGTYLDSSYQGFYPTTFARVGDRFLVVNSQFDKRGPNLSPVLPFTVGNAPVPGTPTGDTTPGMPTTGNPLWSLFAALLGLAAALGFAGARLRARLSR
ncbi:MAG: SMP-30/gluconolactonase/LRE family protein [Chloroflexota bacterium]|nr:SMP-30/gluconolactonase/LRE family protein [Chloroflexota bacterium]